MDKHEEQARGTVVHVRQRYGVAWDMAHHDTRRGWVLTRLVADRIRFAPSSTMADLARDLEAVDRVLSKEEGKDDVDR